MTTQVDRISFEIYQPHLYFRHLQEIAHKLSDIDKKEALGMSGGTPLFALEQSLSNSVQDMRYILFVDGEPEGAFGLTKSLVNRSTNLMAYSPWLLASDKLKEFPMTLTRTAREIVTIWSEMGLLANFVSTENKVAIKWLQTLGFTVDTSKTHVFYGKLQFYLFFKLLPD